MPNLPVRLMPSLLGAHLGELSREIQRCVEAEADGLHLDMMDGHLVPNLSFGPALVTLAKRQCDLFRNVHLMIDNPDALLDPFMDAGAELIHVHVEAPVDHADLFRRMRARGVQPGIALNPATPVARVESLAEQVEEVLFMTVVPGFGGQAFMPEVLPKIRDFVGRHPEVPVAVDGGLNRETCLRARDAGASVFHIGSHLFNASRLDDELAWLREHLQA